MQRATISVFCMALAVGLTTGSPLFYESARVLNKVEFSDLGIDGDRIDPLIDESEEEQQSRNITVSSHTDISEVRKNDSTEGTDTGEQTDMVLKVTVISSNGLPDQEVTDVQHISTTKTTAGVETTGETTTFSTPEKTTQQNGTIVTDSTLISSTSDHVVGNNTTSTMGVDSTMLDVTTQLMPKISTKDIQSKEETATVFGGILITTTLVDEASDVTTISPVEDDKNMLEKETTTIILATTIHSNSIAGYASTEDVNEITLREFTTTSVIMTDSEQATTAELFMERATNTAESNVTTLAQTTETIDETTTSSEEHESYTDITMPTTYQIDTNSEELTTLVQTKETMADTTTSREDPESFTIVPYITDPSTVTTDTDSEEFSTTASTGASTSTAASSIEVLSEEIIDSTVFATTETIPVTEQFVRDTNLQESTTEEMVQSAKPTESLPASTVVSEVDITESVPAAETTPVYLSSEIVDRETSMTVSSIAFTEEIAKESDTDTEISTTETITVLQITLRSNSFTENDLTTITATSDGNNFVDVEQIGTTQLYSTSEFITVTEASETTTSFVETISSTTFFEEPTVIVTSAAAEGITTSTFEITTEATSLQTNQANETVGYDTTRTESVSEETFQPKWTNGHEGTTGEEVVESVIITTDSSDGQILTTGKSDVEFSTTPVGNGLEMLTTTVTEEVTFTTTEEPLSITTANATFAEVDEEHGIGSSSNRTTNTAKEHEIPQTSTSETMEVSFEEASDNLSTTSTSSEVTQQSTETAAIFETEQIKTTETISNVTFSSEEEPSTVTSTTETYLPPMTEVSASDESFIASHFLTQESTDLGLEISSSATITILALVTASPPPSTTHSTLGLMESEQNPTEIFSTEPIFTQSVIVEETEVVDNETVVTLPDRSEDSVSNAPATTSPQLKQESSVNALTTPNIDSGSNRHGPHINFAFSLVILLSYHLLRSFRSSWL